jgi:hypothetical protein
MAELEKYDHGPTKIERNRVIERLEHSFAQDLLDVDIYEKRLQIAINTGSKRELHALIEDLPEHVENQEQDTSVSGTSLNHGIVKDHDVAFVLMSGLSRKGLWYPPKRMEVIAVMGGVDLDYTEAEIPPGVSNIDIIALMGGVDIIVPEGINVEVIGVPVFGGIDNHVTNRIKAGAPTIKIKAVAIMGGIDIKIKRSKKHT